MSKIQSPIQVYEIFREGMLLGTETWKETIAEKVTIVGPLVQLKGKENFINIHESFFQSVIHSTLNKVIEHNNLVITQVSTTLKTTEEATVTLEINEWYTIVEGKIEALVVYFDTAVLKIEEKDSLSTTKKDTKV